MTQTEVISRTHEFLKEKFSTESSGHDYHHMYRTWKMAKHIASKESAADGYIVELGALLHDIADWKFHDGDEEAGPRAAREWLESLAVDDSAIAHVEDIIRNVSFKGASIENKLRTIEGKIVHDADKLDAMGAIGIGRAFAYGGAKGRPMHDPARPAQQHQSFEAYKNSDGGTINHFYEKLLLLKDRMLTDTGRAMAAHRHTVTEQFLEEFLKEWEGTV